MTWPEPIIQLSPIIVSLNIIAPLPIKEFLPILNDLVDIRSYSLETDSLEKIFIKAVKEKS